MRKVWLIVKDCDWFYGERENEIDVFNSLESAQAFFKEYTDIIRDDLMIEYPDEEIEVTTAENYHFFYIEDTCGIEMYIKEKDVMSYEEA